MAPSQLKQLKASLREHGVLGPQKSKKQQKANAKDATKRLQRHAALDGIRERFNPFEAKTGRKEKFEVATGKPSKAAVGRPGVTRGLGEERRRETLLREMQSRNKVGGMLDRRFGENDPTMSLEEKAAERFARQSMRTAKKNSMFNLEDDSEDEMVLTHGGRSLEFGGSTNDDFTEDLSGSDEEDFNAQDDRPRKRVRIDEDEMEEQDGEDVEIIPERRKTKNEVMKEIIAKSKMHKAERQAAKADDDDLRAELDKGMGEFYEALRNNQPVAKQLPSPPVTDTEPTMDPSRAAMLAGKSREAAEKEYEANLRQLKLEARSKPSVRTKTEEEKAVEQAEKLEELERKRLRRMKGEAESSDEEEDTGDGVEDLDDEEIDDAEAFGLAQPQYPPRPQLEVEDEDEFVMDDIIASDSEADIADSDLEFESESEIELDDDGDDDFINGLVLPKMVDIPSVVTLNKPSERLAYTFPCPQSHDELLKITKDTKLSDLATIVQRIRALYHKGLAQDNQVKLGKFAAVLLEHISYLANSDIPDLHFSVLESLLRHLHSIAKSQPEDVGLAFRDQLREIAKTRPLQLLPGDLVTLTGVSTIFPTSDHFHTVATPAMLTIARYLGQSSVQTLRDLGVGAYCCTLALQYQGLAGRYVPEVVSYIINSIAILAPQALPAKDATQQALNIPIRLPETSLRITKKNTATQKSLSFDSLRGVGHAEPDASLLLNTFIYLSVRAAELWQKKTAIPEIIQPLIQAINHLQSSSNKDLFSKSTQKLIQRAIKTLSDLRQASLSTRTPLLLHNHRPLAIKSSIPSFVENYNPDRHYDPDRERAEMAKLKAEHKKERKGAMRELRKDANFVAREQLREKKAKDEAYDKKFKRLVAEIQGEEGREAKEYEREKAKRRGKS